MKISTLTIHPKIMEGLFSDGLLAKARAQNKVTLDVVNIRDYAEPPHHRVDDRPFGGGPGMILKVEPISRALEAIVERREKTRVVLLSARGKKFTQRKAAKLTEYDHVVLIAGRYEGIDERVAEHLIDEEIRIGDYILMGGEVAAGVMIESVVRLLPGVLGNPKSLEEESFSVSLQREYVQYTRPREFNGWKIPDVLLSGHHAKVSKWRKG